jgi:putative PEP-CTERM system histidine kinase
VRPPQTEKDARPIAKGVALAIIAARAMRLVTILTFICSFFACGLGVTAVMRRPRTVAHWTFLAGMLLLAGEALLNGISYEVLTGERTLFWQKQKLILTSLLPGTWLLFSLTYSRGNYRRFLKRWLPVLVCVYAVPLGLVFLMGDTLIVKVTPDVQAYNWLLSLGGAGLALYVVHLLTSVVILMHLERTFQASVGTMRWRIKFMVLGLGVIFGVRFYTSSQYLLFASINLSLTSIQTLGLFVAGLLLLRSLLREGLFGQDIYPSHSLLRYSLTGLLAGIYLLAVGILAKVVTWFGGETEFPLKALMILISIVGVTILFLSERVRQFSRRFVTRHLRRPYYDYRQVWMTFTERTASVADKESLGRAVVKWVSDTFNVLSVTLWFVDDAKGRLSFGTSTSVESNQAEQFLDTASDGEDLVRELGRQSYPVDIEHSDAEWAQKLKRQNPKFFPETESRICVPIAGGGNLLGVMVLGDRVNALPFTGEDFDLLKCMGEQVAANLLNIQLSERLLQVREMEAFQLMSAFFVHDLKNTASTLSLMLKNMPAHFDDPTFREDALRGLSKSVTRINDLISRLGLLRQGIAVTRTETDFNDVTAMALKNLQPVPNVTVTTSFRPVPKVSVDAEQIRKVITNLIMNAVEAVDGSGEVRLETASRPGQVLLSISDNGCGMTREFMLKSLFRPFQTTKKKGIGIGMFLSKRIVEAHGGKIEVESQPGQGSTFRIVLPTAETRNET